MNSHADQSQSNLPEVWIAILHYLDVENTRSCVEACRKLDYKKKRILVIVNGSPDGSGPELQVEFPEIEILHLPSNLGFAGGSNAGIRHCMEAGAQWIWLLNNDTEPDARSLTNLMAVAAGDYKAGFLGARIMQSGPDGQVASGVPSIDFKKAKTYERGKVSSNEPVVCPWLSGSNLLIRAETFRQTGGFDENYFLYFEDTDLCFRATSSGWRCLLVPEASIFHIGGASTKGKLAVWRSYYYTRNRLLFFLTNCKGMKAIPVLFAVFTHVLRHSITLPLRGEDGKRQLKAELLGLRDYFAGKRGEADCLDF